MKITLTKWNACLLDISTLFSLFIRSLIMILIWSNIYYKRVKDLRHTQGEYLSSNTIYFILKSQLEFES